MFSFFGFIIFAAELINKFLMAFRGARGGGRGEGGRGKGLSTHFGASIGEEEEEEAVSMFGK